MPADFEDRFNPDNLSDDELRRVVRQELEATDTVDADNILVTVREGVVILGGRVGTEAERRVAERVVSDVIGAEVDNQLLLDEIRRDEEPEAIDDHLARRDDTDEEPLGRTLDDTSDTAESTREDLDARLFGTHNVGRAIADATPWEPPDNPTPEGFDGEILDPDDDTLGGRP
ncbi:MAG TPA: BON domain-containing protein [Gemmatimonadaceae bacterium]|nr:BON domain-containing protein [Gemmatimonadaceae bacterium]